MLVGLCEAGSCQAASRPLVVRWFPLASLAYISSIRRAGCLQVVELMGAEEPSLADFVMQNVASHAPPSKLMTELSGVLDEDTEGFVVKLYRMVIFESQKSALGLSEH